jgi:hypothetical protein
MGSYFSSLPKININYNIIHNVLDCTKKTIFYSMFGIGCTVTFMGILIDSAVFDEDDNNIFEHELIELEEL